MPGGHRRCSALALVLPPLSATANAHAVSLAMAPSGLPARDLWGCPPIAAHPWGGGPAIGPWLCHADSDPTKVGAGDIGGTLASAGDTWGRCPVPPAGANPLCGWSGGHHPQLPLLGDRRDEAPGPQTPAPRPTLHPSPPMLVGLSSLLPLRLQGGSWSQAARGSWGVRPAPRALMSRVMKMEFSLFSLHISRA